MKILLLILALAIPCGAQFTSPFVRSRPLVATGCGAGYAHYVSLSVASTSIVGGSDLTNYPALIGFNGATSNSITLANLKTTANGGQVQSSSGYDVIFCSAASGGTQYNHELVSGTYNGATGAGEWYVKIPDLSASAITVIYLFWDNASAVNTATCNTWSNSYGAVYHFGQSSLVLNDSTCNAQNLAAYNTPTSTSGEFGGAANLVASSSQYLDAGAGLNYTTAVTVEAWVNVTGSLPSSTIPRIVSNLTGSGYSGYELLLHDVSDGSQFYFQTGNAGTLNQALGAVPTPGIWYSLASTYSGSTGSIYQNGSLQSSFSDSGAIGSSSQDVNIGRWPGGGGQYWNGPIDEVRISNVARTSGWLGTQYANQSNCASFLALGTIH